MANNTTRSDTSNPLRINVNQKWEVAYWTRRFGCTTEQFMAVVRAVGTNPFDVRQRLMAGQ